MTSTPTLDPETANAVSSDDVIDIDGVSKIFGATRAVDNLSLRIRRGETVALLGPNGAGKTTTIGMLLGLLRPDQGRVRLFGAAPEAAVGSGRVGAMLQDGGMMPGVRVAELLRMLSHVYPNPMPVERAARLAQLDGLEDRRVDRLSGGQTQRLRVAVALIGDPELLILDEPTAAMDVEARRTFWRDMGEQAAAGRTILFSTHYLDEADEHCNRVVVIGAGRLLADGSPGAIKASVGLRAVRFSADHGTGCDVDRLPGVTSTRRTGNRFELRCSDADAALRAVIAAIPDAHDIEVGGAGLEEAFLAITDGSRNS